MSFSPFSTLDLASGIGWLALAALSLVLAALASRYRRLYLAARDQEANYGELVENLTEGIYRSSLDGRQLSANPALVRFNGYSSEAEMLAGVKDIASEWYVEPGRRDAFSAILHRDGKIEDFVSEVFRHKSRERVWITESARLVRDKKIGRPLYYEGSVREITETIRRLQLEERFRKLTNEVPGGLFQFTLKTDGGFNVPYLSEGIARISGLPFDQHLAKPEVFNQMIVAEDLPGYDKSLRDCMAALEPWDHEFRLRAADGSIKWLRITARPEATKDGVTWHGYVADISSRKKQELEILKLAYFDQLTRLPNRRMFLDRTAQTIAECDRKSAHAALLFIDLDNFKTLNDTQGHDVGDTFLAQVAERLLAATTDDEMVARIGGDEFVVLIENIGPNVAHATQKAITCANQILAGLRDSFELGPIRHVASASVGIVVFDGREQRAEDIMKRADIAMYEAKAAGKNGVALFDPVTMDRESEQYRLLADLRLAFQNGQLDLYYQPQVDENGMIAGAEALVRWLHPTLGLILPDRFIPLVEHFGLDTELARFVASRGLAVLAGWQRDPRTAHLRLALNVSVRSFSGEDLVPMLRGLVAALGIDATKLTLELTEHVMAKDQHRIAARMAEVKSLGVRLSLDDFGTGYSSLAYLKRLPFDEVKIDGRFVADIEKADSDRALVKTILAMAHTLGLTSVAEHVENIRQEAFLRAFGCDFFQGYLYGPAVPAERFLEQVYARPAPQAELVKGPSLRVVK